MLSIAVAVAHVPFVCCHLCAVNAKLHQGAALLPILAGLMMCTARLTCLIAVLASQTGMLSCCSCIADWEVSGVQLMVLV